jgi:phospholipid/cholesterol/gamma-HCH transport system substrate-binding protein
MRLDRHTRIKLAVFAAIAVLTAGYMTWHYIKLPAMLWGIGRYTITVELPDAGGLYPAANVTYRGTEVGRVQQVQLTPAGGVQAVLALNNGTAIPADLTAEVHSQTAIGEQYLALVPRSATAPPLKDGDVIPLADSSVPPDINGLLNATNTGLQAIPHDNLKTTIDESYIAVGGLGPELSRLVNGSTTLASDAQTNLGPLTTLIDKSAPVLNSQTQTADSVQAWAANIATVTKQLQQQDDSVRQLLPNGAAATDQGQQLLHRLQPTLPIVLANLVSLDQVALTYQPNIEQLLVLVPRAIEILQGIGVANRNTKQDYRGAYLDFNLNLNNPPPCTTGFIPPQQRRVPSAVDSPERPPGDVYCRVPQDSPFNVRGARNLPCETVPGKRAPTVAMCESDENYVPLNDGYNWKGDPNATLSGQPVPQLPPAAPAPPLEPPAPQQTPPSSPAPAQAPLPVAEYDPATGTYTGPDGRLYTQSDLAHPSKEQTWQSMLLPPN